MDRVDVICFPADDSAFAQCVRDTKDRHRGRPIEEIQALVRDFYSQARLVKRSTMAEILAEPGVVTWYAFRDGRVVP